MATTHCEPAEFLQKLETLLEQTPEGQDAALRDIEISLGTLRNEQDYSTLEKAFEALGTAVGKQKEWQTSFREAGILDLALENLGSTLMPNSLRKQYLRVIGNCVADNDLNRESVTKNMERLTTVLQDVEELLTTTLIVLFNLCNDYDPAKAAAAVLRLDAMIADRIWLEQIPEEALDYAVDLLSWTTGKLTEKQLKDTVALRVFENILKVTLQYDEDHFHEYVAILVHYMQDPEFQQRVVLSNSLDDLVALMFDFEARLSPSEIEAVFQELAVTKTDDTVSSEETSVLLLSQLINSISALSAHDVFASSVNKESSIIKTMKTKLSSPADNYPSAVCACVMVGNLAMSDAVCIDMVEDMQLHIPLRDKLFFSKQPALLYAALGFLRHLAFPEANRTKLGDARIIEGCQNYLNRYPDHAVYRDPSVRGEVAALLCKLVTNNSKNIERVVMHRVGELRGEPGELPLRSVTNGPSCLNTLVEQSLQPAAPLPSTAMKNIMVEAGRTIVAILRYLGRVGTDSDIDVEAVRQRMFECANVAKPVARLVRQRFYADARSEGLLGLGLMAQSPAGAARVTEELKDDVGLLEAIKDFAEGKDGGIEAGAQQQEQTAGRDYQNAIVLLQALENNWGGESDGALKDKIVSLKDSLGKLMI